MVSKQQPQVLITGASGAIGGALARHYAEEGWALILQGRDSAKLTLLGQELQDKTQVILVNLDLTDRTALNVWLSGLEAMPPQLVIANAGMNINTGKEQAGESPQDQDLLLELNIRSTLHLGNRLGQAMKQRGHGQLVFISSLAGYYGLPATPSYCASKAAIKAFGESLRGWLSPYGIGVTVVMPGYVHSPMCHAMPGPKPFICPPERAAKLIAKGVAANRARITFPFPLNFGCWWLAVLPSAISQRILPLLGYRT